MKAFRKLALVVQASWIGAAGLVLGLGNDFFENATIVQGPSAQVTGDNYVAFAETNEPDHYAGCPATHSVWWTWTPSASGHVSIHTLGSDFDTVLAVYTGSTLGALTPVASGEDWGARMESLVEFDVAAGVPYRIAVDGWDGAQGLIRLTFLSTSVSAPTNGTFESRAVVSGMAMDWSGSNSNAVVGENGLLAPLWWSWTATNSCLMEADTRGSGVDTVLAVYTGSALGALTETAGNDNRGGDPAARLWWAVEAGTTYQIAVDGAGGAWGAIHFSLREVERPVIDSVGVGTVRWGSLTGEYYRVLCSTNFSDWVVATSSVASATATAITLADAPLPQAFLRVERYLP